IMLQPSFMPRFSAAMEGCLIHAWSRWTASSWRFSISFHIGLKSGFCANASRGIAIAAALTILPARKSRLFMGGRIKEREKSVQSLTFSRPSHYQGNVTWARKLRCFAKLDLGQFRSRAWSDIPLRSNFDNTTYLDASSHISSELDHTVSE